MVHSYSELMAIVRKHKEIYEHLQSAGFTGNLRHETAARMGMSTANADRYGTFGKLDPLVQTLVRDYNVGMSSLLCLAVHDASEQQQIYDILIDAHNDGAVLSRDFITHVVGLYRCGKFNWSQIRPECTAYINKSKRSVSKQLPALNAHSLGEIEKLSGTEFEIWFAQLLKRNGYTGVSITRPSNDGGVDIIAYQGPVCFIFQCKNSDRAGIRALQEIWFAKTDKHHTPVVVTRGRFSKTTLAAAKRRGILCWDGKKLLKMIENTAYLGDMPLGI